MNEVFWSFGKCPYHSNPKILMNSWTSLSFFWPPALFAQGPRNDFVFSNNYKMYTLLYISYAIYFSSNLSLKPLLFVKKLIINNWLCLDPKINWDYFIYPHSEKFLNLSSSFSWLFSVKLLLFFVVVWVCRFL